MAALLSSCGKTIDAAKIEKLIQEGLVQAGGSSIKSVICPKDVVQQQASKGFICTGILDSGNGFDIDVQQKDAEGNVDWKVASIKGLLHMPQVQDAILAGLEKEVGKVELDCPAKTAYYTFKPGDTLECAIRGAIGSEKKEEGKKEDKKTDDKTAPKADKPDGKSKEPDKVLITMLPSGELNWQRLTPAGPSDGKVVSGKDTPGAKPDAKTAGKPDGTTRPDAKSEGKAAAGATPTPAAGTAGNSFLDDPKALDGLD
ncbi:MAG: hypothetical protein HC860_05710 [Alkalinema sp. RU_4_3]|nr:hypothetical protein [Alkalinema sp. RU_4_3]